MWENLKDKYLVKFYKPLPALIALGILSTYYFGFFGSVWAVTGEMTRWGGEFLELFGFDTSKYEYYKLQKTFEGAIKLEKVDGQYVPSKKQGAQGIRQKSTLDEILDKINEKYKGQFTDGDRVMLGALHDKLIADEKLASSACTLDPRIFTESIFPSAFGNAAMESYMEAQDSYGSLFEDKSKYDAVMSVLAGVIYREMRSKKTVDYRKIQRDEQVQMVAEEPVKYGK